MHHTITVAILLVALALYAAGFSTGAVGILIAAVIFELVFWYRIIRGLPKDRQSQTPVSP